VRFVVESGGAVILTLTTREVATLLALCEQEADGLEEEFDTASAKERVKYLRALAARLKRKTNAES
jgi:PHD/YefM family antitoxin component YafN of YafNO toxin-antitoxin module